MLYPKNLEFYGMYLALTNSQLDGYNNPEYST
jgi:hypothetical protein